MSGGRGHVPGSLDDDEPADEPTSVTLAPELPGGSVPDPDATVAAPPPMRPRASLPMRTLPKVVPPPPKSVPKPPPSQPAFDAELRALYPEIDEALESLEMPAAAPVAPAVAAAPAPPVAAETPAAPPPNAANPWGGWGPPPPWGPWGWGPPPPGWAPADGQAAPQMPPGAPPGWGPPPGYPYPGMYPGMPYPYPPGAMPPGAMPPGAMPPGAMPPGSGAYPAAYPAAPPAPASNPVMPIPIHRPVEQPPVVVGPSATSSSSEVLITLQDVVKQFERGGEKLTILENLNIKIRRGSFDALMGPSGSGKSTLLNIIAGLDRPTSGIVEVGGVRMDQMGEGRLAKWRADNIGFVYQQYNLIPVMTAIENVELPLLLTKVKKSERRQRARTALRIVGLEDRMGHFPRQLSGGQEQRVAIARAIVNDPAIIVADEPTGDLDRQAADDILLVLEKLARELGKTIVMVTHDPAASARAFVQHRLDKGRIIPR